MSRHLLFVREHLKHEVSRVSELLEELDKSCSLYSVLEDEELEEERETILSHGYQNAYSVIGHAMDEVWQELKKMHEALEKYKSQEKKFDR